MLIPLLLLAFTAYYFYNFYSKARDLPPGPTPLPLIGNFHQLAYGIFKKGGVIPVLQEWKEKYGPVFTTWTGPMTTVNIADYNIAIESMVKKGSLFANRTTLFLMEIARERTIGNTINRMLFSEPFGEGKEDEYFQTKQMLDEMMDNSSLFDLLMNEWNCKFWPFKPRYDRSFALLDKNIDFFGQQIKKRQGDIESGEHVIRDQGEDFVDAYLLEMNKPDLGESFCDETLAVTLFDLWAAGQDTTATTLYWAFAYLVLNPEIKKSLLKELDSVVGEGRVLQLAHKKETPYLNSTLTILGNFLLAYDMKSDPEASACMTAVSETGVIRKAKPFKLILTKRC